MTHVIGQLSSKQAFTCINYNLLQNAEEIPPFSFVDT